jgi:hypothetical protein
MQPENQNKKLLLVGAAILFSAAVLVWYFTTVGAKVKTEIYVVPSDTTVTMDGKPIKTGQASISKGKHVFKGTRQYFGDVTKNIDTATLTGKKTIYLALAPNDPRGDAFLDAHPEERARYERVSGAEFSALQERLINNFPVISRLPYQTVDYKIDYDVTKDKQNIVFLVRIFMPNALTPGTELYDKELLRLKKEALGYLERNAVDTKKATITFSTNP